MIEDAVTGLLPVVLLEAAVIALPLSFGLLAAYRRAVQKRIAAIRDDGPRRDSTMAPGGQRAITLGTEQNEFRDGDLLLKELSLRSSRSLSAVLSGGVAYGFIMSLILLWGGGEAPSPLRLLVLTTVFGFSGVLVGHLASGPVSRRRLWIGYASVFLVVSLLAMLTSPDFSASQMLLLWAIFCLAPSVFALAFAHPRIAAVGPLVFAFAIIADGGANISLFVLDRSAGLLMAVSGIAAASGLNAIVTFILIIVIGSGVLGIAGWSVLRWIGRSYTRKSTSSQLLLGDAVMLMFMVIQGVVVVAGNGKWIPFVGLAFGAYWIVSRVMMTRVRRRVKSGISRHLLVLRPFSLGRPHAKLFEAVARDWRFLGSVQVIVGPDLTSETVEPDEFLDFIARKLDRHFVDGSQPIDTQLEALDFVPDSDGRYRVNQVLCYSNIWREVFLLLARVSHVVMMDLRGFNATNEGTKFEIQTICTVFPLSRTLFLVDETTDMETFHATAESALTTTESESANFGRELDSLQVLNLRAGMSGSRQVVSSLCRLAG